MLELGCGNSQLCEELYRDGITELTCIDLSPIAVDKMKQRLVNKGYKGINTLSSCSNFVLLFGFLDLTFLLF